MFESSKHQGLAAKQDELVQGFIFGVQRCTCSPFPEPGWEMRGWISRAAAAFAPSTSHTLLLLLSAAQAPLFVCLKLEGWEKEKKPDQCNGNLQFPPRSQEERSSSRLGAWNELGLYTASPLREEQQQPGKISTVPLKSLLVCSSSGINIPVGKTAPNRTGNINGERTLAASSLPLPLWISPLENTASMAMGTSNSSWGDYS